MPSPDHLHPTGNGGDGPVPRPDGQAGPFAWLRIENATIRRYRRYSLLAWSVVLLAVLGWDIYQDYTAAVRIATTMAREQLAKDLLFRRWASLQGGVYAPVSPHQQPNPHLQAPERDIATPSGRQLTLVNPAYMMRQVYALGRTQGVPGGHITGEHPIRPENTPDAWEQRALDTFKDGKTEYAELVAHEGQSYFRLMRPLVAERSCLPCHAGQGCREGDHLGGLSVAVPWAPIQADLRRHLAGSLVLYGLAWILGTWVILVAHRSLDLGMTARERAETRALEANERLRETNQLLNDFAHTVAHDLKSPLSTMMSAMDMIATADRADPDATRRGLEMCQRSGQRMLRLISDILVGAAQAGGKPDVELVQLDVILREVVEDLAGPLREKDGRVEVGPLPEVTGSRTHLRRVFQNLVANSVKYSRPGVPPLVRVSAQEVSRKEASAAGLRLCRITVEDNGVGFSDEEAGQLFKPFRRLRNAPAEGSGIGLAAVKGIVAAHCGSITAGGTPGAGARFVITLPLNLKPGAAILIRRELRFACRKERHIDLFLASQTGATHRFTVTDESPGGMACASLPFKRLQPGLIVRLDDGQLYEVRWVREGTDGLVRFGMMRRG